jgi:hypothetical protein
MDGKKKDIYETFQSAFDTAKYIEEERGIFLEVYECPHGNGWHLTKSDASSVISERRDEVFRNNNIPTVSSNGLWEYEKDESDENDFREKASRPQKTSRQTIPITKIECKQETRPQTISGKIMEIVKNIDIEKMFKINLDNQFCAKMLKGTLDGIIYQLTVYSEKPKSNQLESYTILAKKDLLEKHKINKGRQIKLNVTGKSIANKNYWYCDKVEL